MAELQENDAGPGDGGSLLRIVVAELDGRPALRVCGEVDLSTAAELRSYLDGAADSFDGDIVVDVAELVFIDSSGLAQLVGAARALPDRRVLVLHNPTKKVRNLLDITGLTSLDGIEVTADGQHGG
jgi:anti-sigma B factor antagonist